MGVGYFLDGSRLRRKWKIEINYCTVFDVAKFAMAEVHCIPDIPPSTNSVVRHIDIWQAESDVINGGTYNVVIYAVSSAKKPIQSNSQSQEAAQFSN